MQQLKIHTFDFRLTAFTFYCFHPVLVNIMQTLNKPQIEY